MYYDDELNRENLERERASEEEKHRKRDAAKKRADTELHRRRLETEIDALERDKANLERDIRAIELETRQLEAIEHTGARSHAKENENELRREERTVASLHDDLSKLRQEEHRIQVASSEAERRLQDSKEEVVEAEESTEKAHSLTDRLKKLEREEKEARLELARLEEQERALKRRISQMDSEEETMRSQISKNVARFGKRIFSKKDESERTVHELQEELRSTSTKIKDIEDQISKHEHALSQLRETTGQSRTEAQKGITAKKRMTLKEKDSAQLTRTLSSVTERIAALKRELNSLR